MSKKDDGVNDRMCIVTREKGEADDHLIRFVAGPDGSVVPDLKRQLPGRGCWVKAERAIVDKAVARKLFARALRADAGSILVFIVLIFAYAALMNRLDREHGVEE